MAGERTVRINFGGNAAGVQRASTQAQRAVDAVASKVGRIGARVGAVVALGAAMSTTAGHAVALASSVVAAAGAAPVAAAAFGAAAATMAAVRAVTFGLADAWTATGRQAVSGGGAAVNTARQVAAAQRQVRDATRSLADAQRAALVAQQAVSRARAEEAERLADLSRSVRIARIDEEDAVADVAAAERELAEARRSGDPDAIAAADRAYRRAGETLGEVRDRVEDLAQEQAEGARKGIQGSDAVQSALERQREAQEGVRAAAEQLADAQQAVRDASRSAAGGINPATEALNKLAPSARAALLQLRAIVPAWQQAARVGQQATFRGTAADIRDLSRQYLPMATSWLTRMGKSFNRAIREAAGLAKTSAFARDVRGTLEQTAKTADRLARAIKPVVNGVMQFVAVGATALPGLAGDVGTLAERFEAWAIGARKSGDAQQWITNGVNTLKQFVGIANDVVMSILAIVRAGGDGGSTVDTLARGAAAMRAWLESAQGQQTVTDVLARMRDVLSGIGQILPVVAGNGDAFRDTMSLTSTVVGFAADHLDTLAKLLPVLAAGFVIAKVAQTGANIAAVVSLPLKAAEVAANWGLRKSMRAHTAALIQNTAVSRAATTAQVAETAATNGGILAKGRSILVTAAQRVATIAGTAATWLATVATTALGAAMKFAMGPVGLVIIAIIALVAGLILAYKKSETFRAIVDGALRAVAAAALWMWTNAIKPAFSGIVAAVRFVAAIVTWWYHNVTKPIFNAVVAVALWLYQQVLNSFRGWKMIFDTVRGWIGAAKDWIVGKFTQLVDVAKGLGGRIKQGLSNIVDVVSGPFKAAFNKISALWNGTVGKLSFQVPSWVPGIGGKSFSLPKLPQLQHGGAARSGRSYLVGERGPEVLTMGAQSGRVTSNAEAFGPEALELHIDLGEGIHQVVQVNLREHDRRIRRRVLAGAGARA